MSKKKFHRDGNKSVGRQFQSWGCHGYSKPSVAEIDPKEKIALQKMMVGHFIESIPEDCSKKVVYVMQGNGVFEQRTNKLGVFVSKISSGDIPGLESNLEEGWVLTVPKIPITLLGTTVSFFRKIYSKHSSEVFVQFYFDTIKEEYIIHCPKQTVSGASVRYDNDEMFTDNTKILVFEIHSHGSMGAFFSGTDDGDEKADRFFGVIGHINDFFPDMKLRISIGGRKIDIDVGDIFDLEEDIYHAETYPQVWIDRIQKSNAVQVVYSGRYAGPYSPDHGDEFFGGCSYIPETDAGPKPALLGPSATEQVEEEASDESQLDGGYYTEDKGVWYYVKGNKRYRAKSKPSCFGTSDSTEDNDKDGKDKDDDWRKMRF